MSTVGRCRDCGEELTAAVRNVGPLTIQITGWTHTASESAECAQPAREDG